MRDGSKIKFWHDLWHGDLALKEAFSVLYSIACTLRCFYGRLLGVIYGYSGINGIVKF